jgi:hypothetical protein
VEPPAQLGNCRATYRVGINAEWPIRPDNKTVPGRQNRSKTPLAKLFQRVMCIFPAVPWPIIPLCFILVVDFALFVLFGIVLYYIIFYIIYLSIHSFHSFKYINFPPVSG